MNRRDEMNKPNVARILKRGSSEVVFLAISHNGRREMRFTTKRLYSVAISTFLHRDFPQNGGGRGEPSLWVPQQMVFYLFVSSRPKETPTLVAKTWWKEFSRTLLGKRPEKVAMTACDCWATKQNLQIS